MKSMRSIVLVGAAALFAFPVRADAGDTSRITFGGQGDTNGQDQFELTEPNGDDVIRCVKVDTTNGGGAGGGGGVTSPRELRDAVLAGLTQPPIPGFNIAAVGDSDILISRPSACWRAFFGRTSPGPPFLVEVPPVAFANGFSCDKVTQDSDCDGATVPALGELGAIALASGLAAAMVILLRRRTA